MFDFKDIRSIHIDCYGLNALLTHTLNNPVAEDDVPAMLRSAIAKGIRVRVFDPTLGVAYRLLHEKGEFKSVQESAVSQPTNRPPS